MTEPPSTTPGFDQRRASDHGESLKTTNTMTLKDNVTNSHQRRRTVGGGEENVPPNTKPLHVSFHEDNIGSGGDSSTAHFLTPSKKNNNKSRVSLGSAAASSYYFSDMPKTPLSSKLSAKKKSRTTPLATNDDVQEKKEKVENGVSKSDANGNSDSFIGLNDTSVLSMGTSSSEESDMLNKSVLSDTTELTASNFVLQASSRQRLHELSKGTVESLFDVQQQASKKINNEINVESSSNNNGKKSASDENVEDVGSTRSPLKSLSDDYKNKHVNSPGSTSAITLQQATSNSHSDENSPINRPSPPIMSRPSPSSARKLTQSLRKKRIERERKLAVQLSSNRSSIGSVGTPGTKQGFEEKLAESNNVDLRLSIGAESQASPIVKNRDSLSFLDMEDDEEGEAILQSKNRRKSSISISSQLPSLAPASERSIVSSVSRKGNSDLDASNKSLDELFQGLLDESDSSNSDAGASSAKDTSKSSSSAPTQADDDAVSPTSNTKTQSNDISERPMTPCFSPLKNTNTTASFKLTPSSHKKLTPSKLSASPGRVLNRQAINSPAQSMKSTEKSIQGPSLGDNEKESANLDKENTVAKEPPTVDNDENVMTPPSSPLLDASINPCFSLTPNSHVKLTPSKLEPSPRRVVNPKAIDSPARNTRSAARTARRSISVESPAHSTTSSSSESEKNGLEIDKLPLSQKSARRETADSSILKDLFADMSRTDDKDGDDKTKAADESDISLQVDDLPPSQQNDRRDTVDSSAFRGLFDDALNDSQSNKENAQGEVEVEVAVVEERMPRSKRRRQSSASASIRLEGDDNTGVYSAGTANTADLVGLLDITEDLAGHRADQRESVSMQIQSPMVRNFIPKSILNSSIKKRNPITVGDSFRRKVAFGSPEAAEYRIGSPSVSLTPMPRRTAKAMFIMPSSRSTDTSTDTEPSQTSSVDSMLPVSPAGNEEAMDKLETDDSSTPENEKSISSSISQKQSLEEEQEIIVSEDQAPNEPESVRCSDESNSDEGLREDRSLSNAENVTKSPEGNVDSSHDGSILSPASSAGTSTAGDAEDVTVELEGNINGLLASTYVSPSSSALKEIKEQATSDKVVEESSPSDSVEMADVASIRSLNTPAGKDDSPVADEDTETLNVSAQKLNFEFKHDESKRIQNSSERLSLGSISSNEGGEDAKNDEEVEEDGDTMELEVNMSSLLASTESDKDSPVDMTQRSHDSTSKVNKSERLSLGSISSSEVGEDEKNDEEVEEDGDTMELEVNMSSLLAATESDKDSPEDMTQQSHNSTSKVNKSERLSFGSTSPTNSDEDETINEEEDVTMELEENMSSLLAATGASRNSLAGMTQLSQGSSSKLTSNLAPPTNRMSFGEHTLGGGENSPKHTVELESNLGAPLQISDRSGSLSSEKPSGESEDGDDESVVMETVELEPSIGELLKTNEQACDSVSDKTKPESDSDAESVTMETVEIEPNLGALLHNADQNPLNSVSNKIDDSHTKADESTVMETIQLEPSMGALLKTTGLSIEDTSGPNNVDQNRAGSSSNTMDDSQTKADESTVMETVQLEPSMGALLKTTAISGENAYGDLTEETGFYSLAQSATDNEISTSDSTEEESESSDSRVPGSEAQRMVVDSNIESVLQQADQKAKSSRKLILSDSPLTAASVSRGRLSISSRLSMGSTSSRRFSMAPKSRLSLSVDESGKIDTSCVEDAAVYGSEDSVVSSRESPGFASVADVTSVIGDMTENIDLTSEEINSVAELIPNANKAVVSKESELLLMNKPGSLGSTVVKEAFDEFLLAVCGEVEGKVGSSSDGEVCLNAVIDDSPGEVLDIQRALRSHDEDRKELIVQQLRSLSSSVKASVSFEWKGWETQVADALKNSVGSSSDDVGDDDMALDRCTTLLDDTHETIAMMAGKAVRRARRHSMHRRKTAAAGIEDEIQKIEIEIAELKATQQQIKSDECSAISLRNAINEVSKLECDLKETKDNAESNHSKFLSLDGLHNWTPVEIESSKAIFAFLGPSPKSCFEVSFDFSKSDFVGVKASINVKHFRQRKRVKRHPAKHTTPTMLFLEMNVSAMMESVNRSSIKKPSDVPPLLQRLGWVLGRLEIHANELTALQRRYSVALDNDPISEKADFLVSVEFSNRKKSTKLKATFELLESYPFTPFTSICLDPVEGEIDVEALNKQLVKNVKPGFRYLSRTCDVIAAFVG